MHTVNLQLHAEVAIPIKVNVARSEDEAKFQSAGEASDAEVGEPGEIGPVEELFEDAAPASDAGSSDEATADKPAEQATETKPE